MLFAAISFSAMLFFISCSREKQEWIGWRDMIMSKFENIHSALPDDNNEFLIFGNIPVEKTAGLLDPDLAAMSGRWEGYDTTAAAKVVLVIQSVNSRFGHAYLWAAQNLQYPMDVKEINFQITETDKKGITWDAEWIDPAGRVFASGVVEIFYNSRDDTLIGIIRLSTDRENMQPLYFRRDDSYTIYRDYQANMMKLSESAGSEKAPGFDFVSADFDDVLEYYKEYSEYTNPGKYEYLYKNLPDDLPGLFEIIKKQLIHPVAIAEFSDSIPYSRKGEEYYYPTAADICAGLLSRNKDGLAADRLPGERLVVSCRYHAVFAASILKSKGIPVRVRYGFASYLNEGEYISHDICEIYDENEENWIFADPDTQLIGLDSEQFRLPADVWIEYREKGLDVSGYGVADFRGAYTVLDQLYKDFMSVLGKELLYYDYAHMGVDANLNVRSIPSGQMEVMNIIAELMTDVDNNLVRLAEIYNENVFLHN